MTELATVCPATKLMLDVAGRVPQANAVTKPERSGATTVRLITTAATSPAGTRPGRSVNCTANVEPAGTFAGFLSRIDVVPGRVSNTRAGAVGWNPSAVASQPERSTTTWVVTLENTHTVPVAGSTGTTAALATIESRSKLRLDTSGLAPHG